MSGRLFCLMGKSASGKDTIYEELLRDRGLSLRPLVPYTTRPMRDGEENGREYFFTGVKEYQSLKDRALVLLHGKRQAARSVEGIGPCD